MREEIVRVASQSLRGHLVGTGSGLSQARQADPRRTQVKENRWQTITSANVATAIVKLVAAEALPVLVGNLVMGNLVNRDYEPVLAQAGDTINMPIPPDMVAQQHRGRRTVQPQNPSLGNAQIVLNTHVEATFQIPDVTKVLAVPDLMKIYMRPAMVAIARGSRAIC